MAREVSRELLKVQKILSSSIISSHDIVIKDLLIIILSFLVVFLIHKFWKVNSDVDEYVLCG